MDKRVFSLAIVTIISAFILVMVIVYATNAKRINELVGGAKGGNAATMDTSGDAADDALASAGDGVTIYGEQIGDNLSGFLTDEEFFDETEQISSLVVIRRTSSGGTDSVSDYVKEPGTTTGGDGNGGSAAGGDGTGGNAAGGDGTGGNAAGSDGIDGSAIGSDGTGGTAGEGGISGTTGAGGVSGITGQGGISGTTGAGGISGTGVGTMAGAGDAEAASEGARADGSDAGGNVVGTGGADVGIDGTAAGTGAGNPNASGEASTQMQGTGMAVVGQLINPNPDGTAVTDTLPEGVANAGAQEGVANAGAQDNTSATQGTSPDSSGYLTTVPGAPPGGFGEYIPADQTINGTPVGD